MLTRAKVFGRDVIQNWRAE